MMSLLQWMNANEQYKQFAQNINVNQQTNLSSFINKPLFDQLETAFIQAANSQPTVDANIQNAIGVLYNIAGNYDKAIDAFRMAVNANPDDARTWNRLGATIANSSRENTAEAIGAYTHALQLYPGYVRARYNLGVSCLHLRAHNEALEHFVSALSLQHRGIGPTDKPISDSIWQTMRVTAMSLPMDYNTPSSVDRTNLLSAIDARNISDVTRIVSANNNT